jgi:hypothetical protein
LLTKQNKIKKYRFFLKIKKVEPVFTTINLEMEKAAGRMIV